MDISEKIEAIRRQPQHIRLRWVWGCVAVSMLFIFAIWIFSMGSLFKGEKNQTNTALTKTTEDINEQLQNLKEQTPSLKNLSQDVLNTEKLDESVKTREENDLPSVNELTDNDKEI